MQCRLDGGGLNEGPGKERPALGLPSQAAAERHVLVPAEECSGQALFPSCSGCSHLRRLTLCIGEAVPCITWLPLNRAPPRGDACSPQPSVRVGVTEKQPPSLIG